MGLDTPVNKPPDGQITLICFNNFRRARTTMPSSFVRSQRLAMTTSNPRHLLAVNETPLCSTAKRQRMRQPSMIETTARSAVLRALEGFGDRATTMAASARAPSTA